MFCFFPVIPPPDLLAKPFSGTSLFRHEASANQTIQVKTHPPLPVCIGLDSVGVSATWVHFHLIPVYAGHVGNYSLFPSL